MGTFKVTRANEHYHMAEEWLRTYWHFSFDHYSDPDKMGFGTLRVFNDDTVQPGGGWGLHPHRDMEIVTFVVKGQLEHRDSSGGGGVVRSGEVQRMSAGTGILHSEFNPSGDEVLRLLQIWILPDRRGHPSTYETRSFSEEDRRNSFLPVVSGGTIPGTAMIHQDATISVATLEPNHSGTFDLGDERMAYVFIMVGGATLGGQDLGERDVARVMGGGRLSFNTSDGSEIMVIDMPRVA